MISIDLFQEIQLRALIVARDVLGPREIENRRARRPEKRTLVARRQKAGAPIQRPALHALVVTEHDVARKIPAFASQPISDPRACARKAGPRDAGVDLVKG